MRWAQTVKTEVSILIFGGLAIFIMFGVNPLDIDNGGLVLVLGHLFVFSFVIFFIRVFFGGFLGFFMSWSFIALAFGYISLITYTGQAVVIQQPEYVSREDFQIDLETRVTEDGALRAKVTNLSQDILQRLHVECALFFPNGKDTGITDGMQIGELLYAGESFEAEIISDYEFEERRADPALSHCYIEYADYYESVQYDVAIEVGYDQDYYKHLFRIHNRGDQAFTNVIITCRRSDTGFQRHIVHVEPLYGVGMQAMVTVEPGDFEDFITVNTDYSDYQDCRLVSALPA